MCSTSKPIDECVVSDDQTPVGTTFSATCIKLSLVVR
jgi:hypothetical protein